MHATVPCPSPCFPMKQHQTASSTSPLTVGHRQGHRVGVTCDGRLTQLGPPNRLDGACTGGCSTAWQGTTTKGGQWGGGCCSARVLRQPQHTHNSWIEPHYPAHMFDTRRAGKSPVAPTVVCMAQGFSARRPLEVKRQVSPKSHAFSSPASRLWLESRRHTNPFPHRSPGPERFRQT